MSDTSLPVLLSEREVATTYKFSLSWLRAARVQGDGVPFVKVGRRVFYRRADLDSFVEKRLMQSTSKAVRHV